MRTSSKRIMLAHLTLASVLILRRRRRRQKEKEIQSEATKSRERRWWVRPAWQLRDEHGMMATLTKEMEDHDADMFFQTYRMSKEQFQFILDLVSPALHKEDTFMREAIPPKARLAVTIRLYHVYKPQTVFTVFLVLLLALGYDAIVYRKVFNRFCTTFPVINDLQLLTQSKIGKLQFLAKSIFAQLIFLRERNPGVFCLFSSCILVCMLLISCVFSSFTLLIFICNAVVLSSYEQLDLAAQKFFDFLMKFEECLTPGCTSANRAVLESFVPEMNQQALAILSEVSDVQQEMMLDDTTDLLPQIIETPESSETEEFNLLPDQVKLEQSTSDESVEINPVERVMIVDGAQDNVNRWFNRNRLSPELSEDTDDLNTSDVMTDSYELVSDEDFHSS